MSRLGLDKNIIESMRGSAARIVDDLAPLLKKHTTTTVERAVLRLMGLDGANEDGVPYPNVVVQHLNDSLQFGAAPVVAAGMLRHNTDINTLAQRIDEKAVTLTLAHGVPMDEVNQFMGELAKEGLQRISAQVETRKELLQRYPSREQPWLYVIVATGNIYEDVEQAKAAAQKGADIVAVIRTTGQSLLDYIPYGPTTEGFGGTYATQENFRIMRQALDEVSAQTGHYVRLVNYASGLCMPEIVVTGAFERLDMMLNDSMYGILFRDINPIRTFVDQYFSRVINSAAEIIINTGEDNYLTTADAVESAHTVLASDCINEAFGFRSGLPAELLGLGHAFEIDPEIKDGFLLELGQAMMLREIFPNSPLKYMPPTKFMSGD
ncbi:lysine 5,6-aminomutase subunit alpha, partial [Myxococcota bacterium]|nr:lysine 5,6-aminomutase subunit alpha [Myxococcota bacterium]